MNASEVRQLLQKAVQEAGSQAAFARKNGVIPSRVSYVLNGTFKCPPTDILNALGLKKVVLFEPK
jgi:DNA-binding transcriptional regulator YdaS (Cro superfamily)